VLESQAAHIVWEKREPPLHFPTQTHNFNHYEENVVSAHQ
jgi:hypothetical protein